MGLLLKSILLAACAVSLASATSHADKCACKYQGKLLEKEIYTNFPSATSDGKKPGMYKDMPSIKIYGTSCGVWDITAGTPWKEHCPEKPDGGYGHADYNWCQQAWCYVDKDCPDAVPSSVFNGSSVAFYSYKACGMKADCYTGIAWEKDPKWPEHCPFDPNGDDSYTIYKPNKCACLFHGNLLKEDIYTNFPEASDDGKKTPGMYKDMATIKQYGTTCVAWDQVKGTPWESYCPSDSDWCHRDYNWCQQPWCYVDSSCETAVASSVFRGSDVAYYSYDTCLGTPDCYTDIAWAEKPKTVSGCPFDQSDNGWYTAKTCKAWTEPAADAPAASSDTAEVDSAQGMDAVAAAVLSAVVLLQALY